MIFSDPKTARIINRLRVLNCIQQRGTISRADLSRELVINKVSISEIADMLIREGLIEEAGKVSGAVGRKPTLLRICREAAFVLAIDIGLKNTTLGIGNLMGELVRFERRPTADFSDSAEFTDYIASSAARLADRFRSPEKIRGFAVTLHADIDSAGGRLMRAADWGLEQIPLGRLLTRKLSLPTVIDQNVRSMLLAERWFGDISPDNSIFYINWGQKIGAAQLAGNTILSVNSEFGHTWTGGEAVCFCGKKGCLETLSGGWSIEKQGNEITGGSGKTVKQLYRDATENKALAEIFNRAAEAMGKAAAVAANIISPDRILIGGGLSGIDDTYYRTINEQFIRTAAPGTRSSLIITRSALGDRAGILGAAALGLDAFIYKRRELDSLSAPSVNSFDSPYQRYYERHDNGSKQGHQEP